MKNMRYLIFPLVFAGLISQAVETDPVGFVTVNVPAASDVAVGMPIARPNEYQGVIQSISGSTLTLAGSPSWSASLLVYSTGTQPKTYFVRIDSGSKEGLVLPIVANDSSSVTVTLPAGEDLTGISTNQTPAAPYTSGDYVSIAPYWTLGSLFSGALPGTQVFCQPADVAGVNISPITYTYNGTSWLRGSTVSNDVCLTDYQGVIVRNNSTTQSIAVTVTGAVPMTGYRLKLRTLAGATRQDFRFFYNSPVPEVIGNVISAASLSPGDQILFTDNNTIGKNKSATTLTWNGTNWLQGAVPVTTTFALQPGWSYLFRKNQTTNPASVTVTSLQSYLK